MAILYGQQMQKLDRKERMEKERLQSALRNMSCRWRTAGIPPALVLDRDGKAQGRRDACGTESSVLECGGMAPAKKSGGMAAALHKNCLCMQRSPFLKVW
jgi:hypothetical protein